MIDSTSASTAEIFAGGLKDLERARVFGTRSAGAALPSVIERLPMIAMLALAPFAVATTQRLPDAEIRCT